MADYRELVSFNAISALNFGTKSCLNEGNVRWGGISITGQQGVTAGLTLNVSSPTAANCAEVLQRLITQLYQKKSVS